MPFAKDPMGDNHEHPDYCSYCYKGGGFCYQGDLKGFKKVCYAGMRSLGVPPLKAVFFTWMVRFAPRWNTKTKHRS